MPKKVTAQGKVFTFDDNVSDEEIGISIDEYFSNNPSPELKKKKLKKSGIFLSEN